MRLKKNCVYAKTFCRPRCLKSPAAAPSRKHWDDYLDKSQFNG